MNWQIAVPVLVVAVVLTAASFVPRIAGPAFALRVLTLSVVLTTLAAVALLVQIGAAGLSEIPFVADLIGWCRAVYGGQHGATPLVGLIASTALVVMAFRLRSYIVRVRADREHLSDVEGVTIVDTERPIAFAVPGNPGGVVISRSMLGALDRTERRVVLAHENAHLRHHHHVFVHAVNGCAAALPLLTPFAKTANFLTERWADEVAADRIGSRSAVAAAIAKVALLPGVEAPAFAQALSGGDVIARFEALERPKQTERRVGVIAAYVTIVVAISATVLQFHHLAEFAAHPR